MSLIDEPAEHRPQQRRRGAVLENALLDAAWDELVDKGYDAFTIDSVAERAQTSRAVIYRRWPTKADVVQAAIAHRGFEEQVTLPDTGSLRGDLIELMVRANRSRFQTALIMLTRLGAFYAETGSSLGQMRETFARGRAHLMDEVLERAAARGEIDLDALSPRVRWVAFDLFRHELMMTLRPVSEETIASIVDEVFLPLVRARPPAAAWCQDDEKGPAEARPSVDVRREGIEPPTR